VRIGADLVAPGGRAAEGARDVVARYGAVELIAPRRVRYRVRLEPYDANWVEAADRREAYYTNLPPGRYRFAVSAAIDLGEFGAPALLEFTLPPRWHETRWFLALCAATLAGALAGAYSLRIRLLKRREAILAARVQEALAQVKTLSGLLPLCAWCKSIRDEEGHWKRVEVYVRERSEAEFTHGICPDCEAKLVAPPGSTQAGR
jgi:hypothetical protein